MKSAGSEFRSRVYTDRPDYADLPSPEKFQAIMGIIATRLNQHPHAICSYIFGDSYRYRQGYNEFKARKRAEKTEIKGQLSFDDIQEEEK